MPSCNPAAAPAKHCAVMVRFPGGPREKAQLTRLAEEAGVPLAHAFRAGAFSWLCEHIAETRGLDALDRALEGP